MKITLEYDESTGSITDKIGTYVAGVPGLVTFEPESSNSDVIALVKLGVSSDDIIKMKNNDLIK